MSLIAISGNERTNELEKIGFSVKETADIISVSPEFIRKKIRAGDLIATYCGRRVIILRENLEKFLQSCTK